jgi:hypothetical protein
VWKVFPDCDCEKDQANWCEMETNQTVGDMQGIRGKELMGVVEVWVEG